MNTIETRRLSPAETVRRLLGEVLNCGNLELAHELLHPEYRYESPTETMNGVAEFQEFVAALRAAFPDPHVAIESIVAIDSRTSTKVRVTGTLEVAGREHEYVRLLFI